MFGNTGIAANSRSRNAKDRRGLMLVEMRRRTLRADPAVLAGSRPRAPPVRRGCHVPCPRLTDDCGNVGRTQESKWRDIDQRFPLVTRPAVSCTLRGVYLVAAGMAKTEPPCGAVPYWQVRKLRSPATASAASLQTGTIGEFVPANALMAQSFRSVAAFQAQSFRSVAAFHNW